MKGPHAKAIQAGLVAFLLSVPLTFSTPQTVLREQSSKEPQQSSRQVPSGEPLVINVTVTNKRGEFVTDLKQSDFNIFEDKVPQPIVSFSRADEPLSIGLLIDASASMWAPRGSPLEISNFVREALASFFALSNKASEYFVIGFNTQPELLLDWTTDTQAVLRELSSIQPKGNTAFYDACYLGIDKVMHGRHSKRVIVLVSDAGDNMSHHTIGNVRRLLKESNVMIYSINAFGYGAAGSSLGMEGQQILNELSTISGGVAFSRKEGVRLAANQLSAVLELIAEELQRQYAIGFLPREPNADKNWHQVKVKLVAPANTPEMKHLYVRAREGYYAGRN
jgi:Ca-activated chloride channel family protein